MSAPHVRGHRWVAGLLALSACAAPPDPAASTAVRDSAGIRIVDNSAATLRAEWRVSSEPTLQIGAVQGGDPATLLDDVVGAVRMTDGRIVIANGGTRELRFFSPDGKPLKSAGRQGQGPGEFRWLMRLQRIHGDTLVAADRQPGKLVWFDSAGEFLFNTVDSIRGAEPAFILNDASLLIPFYQSGSFGGEWESFAVRRRQADDDGFFRPSFELVHIPRAGAAHDTLGRFAGEELFKISAEGVADFARPRPFGRATITGFAPGRIFVAYNGTFDVQVHDQATGLVTRVRKNPRLVNVHAEEREAFATLALDEYTDPVWRSRCLLWLEALPWPPTKPPVRALIGDAEQNLWVAEPAPFGARSEPWSVFDAQGSLVTTVELPAGLEVFEIGAGYILGLWRDPLGVEFVRLYTLAR